MEDLRTCRLYLISPPKIDVSAFAESLKAAFAGGDIGSFQLRLKDASDQEILTAAETLLPIVRAAGAAFILNDRADLAKQIGADGVHLGQDDVSVADARAILGKDAIIGVSCHDSRELALVAGEAGADYVAFGAFYPTKSKDPEKLKRWGTPKPDILEWWQAYLLLPCVAIGGMTPQSCAPLVSAGADFIAAITAVWEHPGGPGAAVKEFNEAIQKSLP